MTADVLIFEKGRLFSLI